MKLMPRGSARARTAPAAATGAHAIGFAALGSVALGAVAIGALAIGALSIGRLVAGRVRIRRLEIDELVVRRVRVTEQFTMPSTPDAGSVIEASKPSGAGTPAEEAGAARPSGSSFHAVGAADP